MHTSFRHLPLPHICALAVCLLAAASAHGQLAVRGKLLFEDSFTAPSTYTKEAQAVQAGWKVGVSHAEWRRTREGVESVWTTGHMPVLKYEGQFGDAVIELDFKFDAEPGKWSACRISATNPTLNPRAYAVSVWANQDNAARGRGMVLEHDEWKPGVITTVENKPATFEPGRWYTLRLEMVGNDALATCNGVTVFGTHEKFGLPKTALYLGTGTSRHELRRLRVYAATRNPAFKAPVAAPATPTH